MEPNAHEQPAAQADGGPGHSGASGAPTASGAPAPRTAPTAPTANGRGARRTRWAAQQAQFGRIVHAVVDSEDATVEEQLLKLSRSRRWLAPLALAIGAVAMLFEGLRLLFSNWRLTLIQVLPAMWIWLAMFDLKLHVLRGKHFYLLAVDWLHGPAVILLLLAVAAITAASFFLNAVFAFAIAKPGRPVIRPAFAEARSHNAVVLGSGAVVGLCLGVSAMIFPRWGGWWFAISLSIVVGVMMLCYVAVPARLIGMKTASSYSKRDKMTAAALGGAIGAVVCTPPYVLGRVGLIMIGSSSALLIPGIIVFLVGLTLQAGTTGAVKAIKMSAKLASARHATAAHEAAAHEAAAHEAAAHEAAD
jgi:hypothetical protein